MDCSRFWNTIQICQYGCSNNQCISPTCNYNRTCEGQENCMNCDDCRCGLGTNCCGPNSPFAGSCKDNCGAHGLCDFDEECGANETCDCPDCYGQKDSCGDSLFCDPITETCSLCGNRVCDAGESCLDCRDCYCSINQQCCSDGTCRKTCTTPPICDNDNMCERGE